ncbi:DUF4430 domain-containing protein [Botrimarina hoheduenensis]|uniref:Transcobalamin-like C-terminal domain-containing protein n=1 Tax=Botrimarina hoheduenensis TaxID=2528000 RepID=A0A5C5W8A5_9BACT|nr:DUF4430 domain-containing protein [Botrimarina hoheduenensis]TWT46687.1 hypothetical protein Pla111_17880 [Botrimarina hoheduenensis]
MFTYETPVSSVHPEILSPARGGCLPDRLASTVCDGFAMIPESPERPASAVGRLLLGLTAALLVVLAWNQGGGIRHRPSPSADPAAAARLPTDAIAGGVVSVSQRRPAIGDRPAVGDLPEGGHAVEIAWQTDLTVYEATAAAGRETAAFASVWSGTGPMAFLESLGGVSHQQDQGLFWQFEVNGVEALEGAGVVKLGAGDRVLWKLAPYE